MVGSFDVGRFSRGRFCVGDKGEGKREEMVVLVEGLALRRGIFSALNIHPPE